MQAQLIETQIWNYLDGTASQQEIIFVERMIATDKEWQQQYKVLQELNELLVTEIETDQPSMRFSKNVMEQIRNVQPLPATLHYINKNIIRSIAVIFIFTITALLVYSFTTIHLTPANAASSLPVDIKNGYANIINFSIPANGTWINLLIMANAVLGLLLLDGLLRRRKKTNMVV